MKYSKDLIQLKDQCSKATEIYLRNGKHGRRLLGKVAALIPPHIRH